MKREITLYGALEKAAGTSTLTLDADNQQQLFAALRSQSQAMDLALRANDVVLVTPNEDDTTARCIEPGFGFGDKAKSIHIATHTEGGYPLIPYIVAAIIAVVASYVITRLTTHMQTNANGSGGAKDTMFNGPANSTDQGGPIAQVCGKRMLIGSTIISNDEDYYNTL